MPCEHAYDAIIVGSGPNGFAAAITTPGGGLHGMCGYYAARAALKNCF